MLNIDLALIICNPGEDRDKIIASVLQCGLVPISCSNLEEARMMLPQDVFRVALTKDVLSDGDYCSVMREAKKINPAMPVIVLSHTADWDSYLKALGIGAFDYIVCPPNPLEAQRIIWSALADTIESEKASSAAA